MTFRRKTSSEVTNENKEHFQDKLKHLGSSIFITLLYDFKKKNSFQKMKSQEFPSTRIFQNLTISNLKRVKFKEN